VTTASEDRARLAALEARFEPGEVETVIDQRGISACGTGGQRGVTIRHRPSGREITVDDQGSQVRNKIAALEALVEQLA
jgi:protein subunit release factor A